MSIRIHNYQDGVTKLGPGTRFVIWTQGCVRSCKGCMTPVSQDINGGRLIDTEQLAELVLESKREGLTISGGEPFLQAQELCRLIDLIRRKADIGVIIYTGYTYEELANSNDEDRKRLLEMADLLVDGPYIDELNDGKNLRGSSNQRAIALTDRYKESVELYGSKKAEVEFFVKENKVVLVGVPEKELLSRFKMAFEEDKGNEYI